MNNLSYIKLSHQNNCIFFLLPAKYMYVQYICRILVFHWEAEIVYWKVTGAIAEHEYCFALWFDLLNTRIWSDIFFVHQSNFVNYKFPSTEFKRIWFQYSISCKLRHNMYIQLSAFLSLVPCFTFTVFFSSNACYWLCTI